MTIWTDRAVMPITDLKSVKVGDRVRMIKVYSINGGTTERWQQLAQPGATGAIHEQTFPVEADSEDDGTVIIAWDSKDNGHGGVSRIDLDCFTRE